MGFCLSCNTSTTIGASTFPYHFYRLPILHQQEPFRKMSIHHPTFRNNQEGKNDVEVAPTYNLKTIKEDLILSI